MYIYTLNEGGPDAERVPRRREGCQHHLLGGRDGPCCTTSGIIITTTTTTATAISTTTATTTTTTSTTSTTSTSTGTTSTTSTSTTSTSTSTSTTTTTTTANNNNDDDNNNAPPQDGTPLLYDFQYCGKAPPTKEPGARQ